MSRSVYMAGQELTASANAAQQRFNTKQRVSQNHVHLFGKTNAASAGTGKHSTREFTEKETGIKQFAVHRC